MNNDKLELQLKRQSRTEIVTLSYGLCLFAELKKMMTAMEGNKRGNR